jgi:YegS/Rv2252/BmrU family lipid kinase
MNQVLLIVNPKSGRGMVGKYLLDIIDTFSKKGIFLTTYVTQSKSDAYRTAKYQAGNFDVIMCTGGDGTLDEVVAGVSKSGYKPRIGYIPSGSTNDFARCLGVPDIRKKAIRAAVKGKAFRYDVGRMNDRYFNYVAAFGAFSEISYDTDQGLKNVLGYAAYVLNAITRLPRDLGYGVSMKIKTDTAGYEGEYVFGAVCNSVSVGGMKLFEKADVQLDDGSMELLLIRSPKSLSDLNSVISSLATGNVDNPNISIHPVKTAVFHSDEDVSWTLDGEYGGSSCDTEISVIQRAMTIRIP